MSASSFIEVVKHGSFTAADDLSEITFRTASDDLGAAVPLFSGIKSETFDGDYDMDGYICWRQDQPSPGILLALMPQMKVEDRG